MGEQPIVDKRGRSRSNTPFLRSSCDHENCTEGGEHLHHERKKSPVTKIPKVQTITEETEIVSPGVTSTKRTSRQVVTTVISSDYSSDDTSTNTVKNNAIQTTAVIKNTPKISETNKIVASTSSSSSAANMATATSSASQYNLSKQQQQQRNHIINAINTNRINTYMETSQNEENKFFELNQKYKTSTPVASGNNQSPKIDFSNGNLSDHIAYKEYKAAGEYWNKYPKTDYTYSKLSPHRRELAPGVVAMPNMSRQSLQHHSNRVEQMALRNPHEEAYIRKRYLATNYDYQTDHQTQFSANNYYDSQDEVDIKDQLEEYARNRKYLMSKYKTTITTTTSTAMQKESIFRRLLTTIYTVYYSFVNIFTNSSENKFRYARMEEKGFFGRISSSIKRSILSVFRCIYLLISSVTYWDTWLLQTSNADNRNKKRFLLFLLLLLPFLLLGAWHQTDESERNLIYTKLPVFSQSVPLAATLNTFNGYKNYVSDYLKNIYKIIFDFNWKPLFSSSQINYNQYSQNIKQSLSDQQYKDLLNHINGYIEKVVIEKLQQNNNNNVYVSKLSPKLSILLASTVKEQLSLYKYELTDNDIEKIAESVRIKLMANNSEFIENIPFKISQNNIDELSQVIKENLVYQKKSAADAGAAVAPDYDINEIIYKIFASPKLFELIDQRLLLTKPSIKVALIEEQQLFINNLVNDINFVKNQLSEQLADNGNIELSLNLLKTDQDKLSNEFLLFQNVHNERLDKLLNEIDIKINSMGNKQFSAINDHVKLVLLEVIGYKLTDGKTLNDIDIKNWIRNIFVAKEFLEERLIELNDKLNKKIQDEKDKMAALLMTEITNNIKKEVLIVIEQNNEKLSAATSESTANYVKGSLDENVIKRIVKDALAVYDADKTGLVDYALESAGGEVLSTRCTDGFQTKTAQISIFGIPLWYQTNTPRTAISPTVRPGECWAFQGFPGFLVLKLNHEVLVTGFTIEHIPKSLSPNGKIESAPRQFTVWGLNAENDPEPVEFGKYEYKENGTSLQYFHVEHININRPYNIVELRIESNHGNENYTCLYRFRVHGHPPPAPKSSPSQSDSTKT